MTNATQYTTTDWNKWMLSLYYYSYNNQKQSLYRDLNIAFQDLPSIFCTANITRLPCDGLSFEQMWNEATRLNFIRQPDRFFSSWHCKEDYWTQTVL